MDFESSELSFLWLAPEGLVVTRVYCHSTWLHGKRMSKLRLIVISSCRYQRLVGRDHLSQVFHATVDQTVGGLPA